MSALLLLSATLLLSVVLCARWCSKTSTTLASFSAPPTTLQPICHRRPAADVLPLVVTSSSPPPTATARLLRRIIGIAAKIQFPPSQRLQFHGRLQGLGVLRIRGGHQVVYLLFRRLEIHPQIHTVVHEIIHGNRSRRIQSPQFNILFVRIQMNLLLLLLLMVHPLFVFVLVWGNIPRLHFHAASDEPLAEEVETTATTTATRRLRRRLFNGQRITTRRILGHQFETVHRSVAGQQAEFLTQLFVLFTGREEQWRLFRRPFVEIERILVVVRRPSVGSYYVTFKAYVGLKGGRQAGGNLGYLERMK